LAHVLGEKSANRSLADIGNEVLYTWNPCEDLAGRAHDLTAGDIERSDPKPYGPGLDSLAGAPADVTEHRGFFGDRV
jgi:hypothetical protein